MTIAIPRNLKAFVLMAIASMALTSPLPAQVGGPGMPGSDAYVVKMYHPAPPLPSYEVATIKKADPNVPRPGMPMPIGGGPRGGMTIKNYILSAYGVSTLSQGQVVGGPAWIGTDAYVIQGKPSDELRDAMKKMTPSDQNDQIHMMQHSLLADRFQLKAHFEKRELPVFELTAAKGGLKIKEVPPPPPFVPGQTVGPPPPPPPPTTGAVAPKLSTDSLRPGMIVMRTKSGGVTELSARAATMRTIVNLLRISPELSGRPIVDKTGFTGNFDVMNLEWSALSTAAPDAGSDADAPSLFTALEEKLGLKLTETKGPVEVLVIDSIERPSEN